MPAPLRRIATVLVLLALYVAGGAYSSLLRGGPDEVALFWPAAGIGLAGVLRYGLRVAWFVPLGTLGVHVLFEPVPTAFLPWSMTANLLGVLAGAWLMRRQPMDDLLTVRFGLHALGGSVVLATVSAIVGTTGMLQAGMVNAEQLPAAASRWLLGDLLGATSIAPAVMLLLPGQVGQRRRFPDSDYASEPERLAWNIALMGSYLLMAWGGSLGGNYALGLVALPLAVMVWSAVRLPPRFTAVASALTMLLIAGLAGFGTAGYPRATDPLDSIYLLVFLVEVAALPLMLAFAMHQQRVAAGVLKHRANIDPLTGMENRNAFEEGMRPVLAEVSTVPMALAYLDLDHLKLINDTASHAAGDQLIRGVAGVIAAHLRPEDRVARTGGDEFALLLRNCTPMVAEDRMRAVLRAIEGYRCGWNGQTLGSTASVGVVGFLPGQAEYAQLLSQADAACFTAKEQGGNRVCLASLDAGELLDRTSAMRWVVRIREALEKNTLSLYCQSIMPLQAGVETGRHFEVLLRLHDPRTGERLEPAQFMPAAERFRLGTRIDREVISQTLAWLEGHPDAAATVETCCINLSGEAVIDEGFIGFVAERLRRSSFPASNLCFELTETSAVRDLARAQRFINQLRELGCRFALDDFGTGFCSFNYLRALDVDYFKIDGSFVRDMHTSPMAAAVVRSINEIAHVLDKKSIAEHTETEAQRKALQALGVDFGQGYAFDAPRPMAEYFGVETGKPA